MFSKDVKYVSDRKRFEEWKRKIKKVKKKDSKGRGKEEITKFSAR
jgi:hypothetical protein